MERDIFSDEEEAQVEVAAEPVEATQTEAPAEGTPRDDKGRFAPKGEEQSASPAPVEEPPFDHAAVIAERRRRREAEQRIAALEAQIQQQQAPQTPPPSIWDDDQAALAHVRDDAVSVAVQQATFNARLDMSEMMTRQANADFDEVKAKFLELASINPSLAQQALSDPHPWNKAYQIGKAAVKMEALGAVDVTDLEAKLREKIMAEQAAQQPAPAPALPNSLAGGPSGRGGGAPTGPQPFTLEDIIGR